MLSNRAFHEWGHDEKALKGVLAYIERYGPYDGLYGFSQGAAVVTALSKPGVAEGFGSKRTWRFVICACGVPPPGDGTVDLPSCRSRAQGIRFGPHQSAGRRLRGARAPGARRRPRAAAEIAPRRAVQGRALGGPFDRRARALGFVFNIRHPCVPPLVLMSRRRRAGGAVPVLSAESTPHQIFCAACQQS